MMPEDKSCAKEEKTAYAAWMAETVEPYLKEHGEKAILRRKMACRSLTGDILCRMRGNVL